MLLALFATAAYSQDKVKAAPPPVVVERETSGPGAVQPASTLYPIGQPTPEEQLFVELINRARADAVAEAQRLKNTDDPDVLRAIHQLGVDLDEMINQFATLEQTVPPLAINSQLTQMARLHSEDMLANVFQGHVSSGNPPAPFSPGDTIGERATAVGYPWTRLRENVFAYSFSVWFGHAGFQIDWGDEEKDPDGVEFGMQVPPGHRETIHSPNVREIGVGVVLGTNSNGGDPVGPMLVTQDFGTQGGDTPFITGVAYLDVDGDHFYDMGEGLGGIEVQVNGATQYAITASSGGYAVPVPGNGSYDLTFSGPNFTSFMETVTVSDNENVKLDLVLTFSPPVISGGSPEMVLGMAEELQLSSGNAAEFFEVQVLRDENLAVFEGGENGAGKVVISQSGSYDVLQSGKVNSGSSAFHLAHPLGSGPGEVIELDRNLLITSGTELTFASQLGDATEAQVAMVEVLPEGSTDWTVVWDKPGYADVSDRETSFSNITVDLASYAGQIIRLRFRYYYPGLPETLYWPGTSTDTGWLIDDIALSNAEELIESRFLSTGDPAFTYTPAESGDFHLRARAVNGTNAFPWGPSIAVSVEAGLLPWQEAWFSAAELADPALEATLWGNAADPDGDGLSNWFEYALGGNPLLPDNAAVRPEYREVGNTLELVFTKVQEGVSYEVRQSPSMEAGSWTTAGVTMTPDPAGAPTGTEIRAEVPIPTGDPVLLRLEVPAP
ncbi:MAG: hypothetical protein GVY10_01815 [Verrucomicrobia bacterium]|nr:hypothetical protein [Verrucomicrobiota bacterium]